VKIYTTFKLPSYFKELQQINEGEYVISDSCEELKKFPKAKKILLMTPKGYIEAGKCTADFYAKNLLEAYLWIRMQHW